MQRKVMFTLGILLEVYSLLKSIIRYFNEKYCTNIKIELSNNNGAEISMIYPPHHNRRRDL